MSQDRAVNDRTEVVLHSVMTILSGSEVFVFQDKNHDFETDLTVAWPFSAMRLGHVAVVSKTPEGSLAAVPISCTFSHSMDHRASMSRELRPLGSPYLGASNLASCFVQVLLAESYCSELGLWPHELPTTVHTLAGSIIPMSHTGELRRSITIPNAHCYVSVLSPSCRSLSSFCCC